MPDDLGGFRQAIPERYAIERELGRGGMSIVFLALDRKHGRRVALKTLKPDIAATVGSDRFLQEIQIASRLQHPHILTLHDSGTAGGLLYYIMPFVEGESLRDRLERETQLPIDDALQIARDVAGALSYAHSHGVVHRDIKPGNIMLSGDHAIMMDFGVARAISAAEVRHITSGGVAVGTPEYMSPEQAGADAAIDGRSDIYSLGCVLHEMLAGSPPFTGANVQTVLARQMHQSPPSLRVVRPTITGEVEQTLTKALAKVPADRFSTADAFAQALLGRGRDASTLFAAGRKRTRAVVVVVGLALLAAMPLMRTWLRRPRLDENVYVTFPLEHRRDAPPTLLNGGQCELLIHQAAGRWDDVHMIDPFLVTDVLRRRGDSAMTLRDARAVAMALGAGRMFWGEVWELMDSVSVRGTLYDVAKGSQLRQHTVRLAGDLADLGPTFDRLVDSRLIGESRLLAGGAGAVGTRSIGAWREYDAGRHALREWDLDSAEDHLRRFLSLDADYPHASFWLGQVLAWAGEAAGEWRDLIVAALDPDTVLTARDRAVALGLLALSENRYQDACDAYSTVVAQDTLDFAAWFGLGECQARDRTIVEDPTSPSGVRFRTSHHAAYAGYRRALTLVPSFNLALQDSTLSRLPIFTGWKSLRVGSRATPDTTWYAAFSSLMADTIAFVPYPIELVLVGRDYPGPTNHGGAVAYSRSVLEDITSAWMTALPSSPDALIAHGLVLESIGRIADEGPTRPGALSLVRRARSMAASDDAKLRLATHEVRFLVKTRAFAEAVRLADSLVDAWPEPPAERAAIVAGLAGLVGRIDLAAEFMRRSAAAHEVLSSEGVPVAAPTTLVAEALGFLTYAAAGVPLDSLRIIRERVETQVQSFIAPARHRLVTQALLDWPAALAFDELGASSVHRARAGGLLLLEAQWLLATGDTAAVRSELARSAADWSDMPPGEASIPGVFQDARLFLALGDTTAARQQLDRSLNALLLHDLNLVDRVDHSVTLVRAMALRATLAANAGDSRDAREWASALSVLWAGADSDQRPVVERMRAIARE